MPRERKQRGRRKKKPDSQQPESETAELGETKYNTPSRGIFEELLPEDDRDTFFGFLDEQESAYFKTIDDTMVEDNFDDIEST